MIIFVLLGLMFFYIAVYVVIFSVTAGIVIATAIVAFIKPMFGSQGLQR